MPPCVSVAWGAPPCFCEQQPPGAFPFFSFQFSMKDDITTQQGQEEASQGHSALSLYLQQMGQMQQDAMAKLYDYAADTSCGINGCEQQTDQLLVCIHI